MQRLAKARLVPTVHLLGGQVTETAGIQAVVRFTVVVAEQLAPDPSLKAAATR